MEISRGATELCWYLVVGWSRTAGVPLKTSKSGSPLENSTSFALKPRQRIMSISQFSIFRRIRARPRRRCISQLWEPLTVADGAILRVTIFAVAMSSTLVLKISELVCSWAGCMMRHFCFLDDIDCFAVDRVLLGHSCVNLIFVLNEV